MKRKIFSILLALVLVLSFSLVTAVPVAAQGVVEEFQSSGLGWVKWAPEEANTGDYSVLLGLVDPTNEARVAVPVSMAFDDLTSLSYWYHIKTAALDTVPDAALKDSTEPDFTDFTLVPGYAAPYAVIELDLNDDDSPDAWVVEARYADDSMEAWEQRSLGTTNYFHAAGGGVPAALALPNIATLATIQADAFFDGATVLKVKVMMGDWHAYITNSPEAYVDDVAVNLVAYPLEPKAVVNINAKWPTQGVDGDTSFDTIQAAIDDALSGQTILAAAGTYVENVVIDIPLTLQGAQAGVDPTVEGARIAPAEESTIDGAGNLGPGVHITATGVRFVGFTVTNFTCDPYIPGVQSGAGMGALWVVGDGAIISENIIYNIRSTVTPEEEPVMWPAGIGIDMAANDAYVTLNLVHDVDSIGIRVRSDYEEAWPGDTLMSGVRVEDNTIYNTANSTVLVAGVVSNVTIRGNEIYNSLPPTPYGLLVVAGASAVGVPNNVLIEGNTIYGSYGNVCLGSVTNITVTGNTIYGAIPHYSNPDIKGKNIYIRDWTAVQTANVTITNNNITGADGYGINIKGNVDVPTITINFNNISGNSDYGVLNEIGTSVDAYVNYWGDISGPECVASTVDAVNPGGIGDKVSDYVYYLPWLTRHFQTVLADNIAYFGIPMVYLNAGW